MTVIMQDLFWGVRRKTIVRGVSLDVAEGATLGLIGPNGSGEPSLVWGWPVASPSACLPSRATCRTGHCPEWLWLRWRRS